MLLTLAFLILIWLKTKYLKTIVLLFYIKDDHKFTYIILHNQNRTLLTLLNINIIKQNIFNYLFEYYLN